MTYLQTKRTTDTTDGHGYVFNGFFYPWYPWFSIIGNLFFHGGVPFVSGEFTGRRDDGR